MERRALRMAELATGHREEALDIVQDAMLVLAKRYGSRTEADWGPLFHRILQSRITDWHRRRFVRNRWRVWLRGGSDDDHPRADPIENRPDAGTRDPDRQLEGAEFSSALEAALHALAPRQRQAFLLRAWEGLDVSQTASAMGCSEGSVKTHYSRAVHGLRAALEGHRS